MRTSQAWLLSATLGLALGGLGNAAWAGPDEDMEIGRAHV